MLSDSSCCGFDTVSTQPTEAEQRPLGLVAGFWDLRTVRRMNNTNQYVTLADLAARWGVSADTARRYTLQPGFPALLPLSRKTLRWLERDVIAWEDSLRAQERPMAPPRPARPRPARRSTANLPAPARVA